MREVPEQWTSEVPAQQMTGVPEQQVEGKLEQQAERALEHQAEQRLTMAEPRPPPQNMGVDPMAAPGGSDRHRRFKKLNRQTKP